MFSVSDIVSLILVGAVGSGVWAPLRRAHTESMSIVAPVDLVSAFLAAASLKKRDAGQRMIAQESA